MAAKRVTKKERELARLTERLEDLAWNQIGLWESENDFGLTVGELRQLQLTVRDRLLAEGVPPELEELFEMTWRAKEWSTAETIAEHLYEHGVRP